MQRRRRQPLPPLEINYLYFGFFFAVLLFTAGGGIFIKENLSGSRIFFFLYAAGQAAIETIAFIVLCWLIPRHLGKIASLAFIGATFVFLVLHLFDFLMDRVLDLSVWETIDFILDETLDNFLYLLDASGISLWLWVLLFALLAALPFIGIAVHAWTSRLSATRPLYLRREWLLQSLVCIPVALFFWEFTASRVIHPDSYTSFIKSLPWKWTFLQPKTVLFPLNAPLAAPPEEQQILAAIQNDQTTLEKRPNIYLFVIESFREDFISSEIAPSLHRFKQESNHFDQALSNGNGSHLSWFSIFHSQFPYCWNYLQTKNWSMGSPPLQLLKKWGYKVRLYSSAQLNYYGMEELLFGKEGTLIDSYQTFHHIPPTSAADTDRQALQALIKDIADNPSLKEGQCCIIFWDSTHFDYSWPENWTPKFLPFSNEIEYFNPFQSAKKIERIKNRYKNAVHYVDSLFDDFQKNIADPEAIVIVTGDHGEEFFEHGHLFHGSHLTQEQTNIPLYMKFGSKKTEHPPQVVSQMDIFPSIFDYLSHQSIPFLQGESIFAPNRWPYAFVSRFNAGRTPYEFCIHNGKNKLIAQFDNKKNIFESDLLKIRSMWNCKDQCLLEYQEPLEDWISVEFGSAINRIFISTPAD